MNLKANPILICYKLTKYLCCSIILNLLEFALSTMLVFVGEEFRTGIGKLPCPLATLPLSLSMWTFTWEMLRAFWPLLFFSGSKRKFRKIRFHKKTFRLCSAKFIKSYKRQVAFIMHPCYTYIYYLLSISTTLQ